jgi:hypothetical protein
VWQSFYLKFEGASVTKIHKGGYVPGVARVGMVLVAFGDKNECRRVLSACIQYSDVLEVHCSSYPQVSSQAVVSESVSSIDKMKSKVKTEKHLVLASYHIR